MVRIRKARYLDKFRFKKMISFLSTDAINHYTKVFTFFPFDLLHSILPLRMKFLPEPYVLEDKKEILGMVTVFPVAGNPYRLDINRLFLEHDFFNAGKQLIEFVVAKYGAKGATNFVAMIDDSYDDLLGLFIDGCGFRQCSCEQLWKMDSIRFDKTDNTLFRPFKNSDAKEVAALFNDTIINHFKCSISKTKEEYLDPIFSGLIDNSQFKYVIEANDCKTLKAYFSISTNDNINYILDITNSAWYDCSFDDIFNFSINQISKRQKDFNLFVKVKKYLTTAESFEKYLVEKKLSCVQNKFLLVKDFYKIVKETNPLSRVVMFNDIKKNPVFKNCD